MILDLCCPIDQQIAIEEERFFVRGILLHGGLEPFQSLGDLPVFLQMKCILEVRPRGAGKLCRNAFGNLARLSYTSAS